MDERLAFVDLQAQRRRLGDAIDKAIAGVVEHGRFIMGPEVAELEEQLGEFTGAAHVVTCSSGTDALLMALMAWGVGPGDAVVVPAFTFPATPEVAALLGATPVFTDVDPDTLNVTPETVSAGLEAAIAVGLRPAVVVAVDLFGLPADYPALVEVAAPPGARVLADAAQSIGARLDDRAVGSLAEVTATSFFPAKPLGCYGDGGAVLTGDAEIAAVLGSLRAHGKGDAKYDIVRVGINGRIDTLQAAVLLAKLSVFAEELEARQMVAARYSAGLEGVEGLETPVVPPGRSSAWAQYTVRIKDRDRVASVLRGQGIPTAVYYPRALHQQPAYADSPRADVAASERLASRVLSLPMHPYLEASQQDRVIEALREAVS